jgi:hypothetical protein
MAANHHLHGLAQSPGARHVRVEGAEDRVGRLKVGKFRAVDPDQPEQSLVVADVADVAVVGHPMDGNRIVRGGKLSGQAQADVINRFQKFERPPVGFGLVLFEMENVRDGIFARNGRRTASEANPLDEFFGRIALDVDQSAGDFLG